MSQASSLKAPKDDRVVGSPLLVSFQSFGSKRKQSFLLPSRTALLSCTGKWDLSPSFFTMLVYEPAGCWRNSCPLSNQFVCSVHFIMTVKSIRLEVCSTIFFFPLTLQHGDTGDYHLDSIGLRVVGSHAFGSPLPCVVLKQRLYCYELAAGRDLQSLELEPLYKATYPGLFNSLQLSFILKFSVRQILAFRNHLFQALLGIFPTLSFSVGSLNFPTS